MSSTLIPNNNESGLIRDFADFDALAHDLKGPLGTIMASIGFMAEIVPASDEGLQRILEDTLRAAQRQNSLIENMVSFIHALKHEMMLDIAPNQVNGLLKAFHNESQPIFQRKGLSLGYYIPPQLPEAMIDLGLLRRILEAIVDNTLKFCTRDNKVEIWADHDDDFVYIRLRDNGRPILPQYIEAIFDPMQQVGARNLGSRTSIAWNLPFAWAAARTMKGDLQATQTEEWTTFILRLPLK